MKFHLHFPRIALTMTSFLLIIAGAALRPTCASQLQPASDTERYILKGVQEEGGANLITFLGVNRHVRASFLRHLITGLDPRLKIPQGEIWIANAVIVGNLYLGEQEIPYGLKLHRCTLEGFWAPHSHFAKTLNLSNSIIPGGVNLSGATMGEDFITESSTFGDSQFDGMRIERDFIIKYSSFLSEGTSFQGTVVDGAFSLDSCRIRSGYVSFDAMQVKGNFSAQRSEFRALNDIGPVGEARGSNVSFRDAHFADFFLNGSSFEDISTIDFSRMQADLISFDQVTVKTPSKIIHDRMTFKFLSPVKAEELQFLFSHYSAPLYVYLENYLRSHGYPDEADKMFIAKKRAERRENCQDFLQQCNRGAWALSMFEDLLAGYGKSLQNLLYWSLGFLVIGTFVFRSEQGMRLKDEKDAPHYEGRYHPFWYSLDLFLPIIKLGEADVWTPKHYRRWANLYRRVHIIIGSLFVPIGLAAWTGIIK